MGVEPENEFVSDDELKSLLKRWVAPEPSRVLDERIKTSFAREFSGADGLSESVLLPHRREEVVSMKLGRNRKSLRDEDLCEGCSTKSWRLRCERRFLVCRHCNEKRSSCLSTRG